MGLGTVELQGIRGKTWCGQCLGELGGRGAVPEMGNKGGGVWGETNQLGHTERGGPGDTGDEGWGEPRRRWLPQAEFRVR